MPFEVPVSIWWVFGKPGQWTGSRFYGHPQIRCDLYHDVYSMLASALPKPY
jgi:hypothetical protein